MPFELPSFLDALTLFSPTYPTVAVSLLTIYVVLFAIMWREIRDVTTAMSRTQGLFFVAAGVAAFLLGSAFPFHFPIHAPFSGPVATSMPAVSLLLFSGFMIVLAANFTTPFVAAIVGLVTGIGQFLILGASPFEPLRFAAIGFLAAWCLQQVYSDGLFPYLRTPLFTLPFLYLLSIPFAVLAHFSFTPETLSLLSAIDLSLSASWIMLATFLMEGVAAAAVLMLVRYVSPAWRPSPDREMVPFVQSLRGRILLTFTLFALFLAIAVAATGTVVANRIATRLVVSQLDQEAESIVATLPDFRAVRQNVLVQAGENEDLLSDDTVVQSEALKQAFRTGNFYQVIILTDISGNVEAAFPVQADSSVAEAELAGVLESTTAEALFVSPAWVTDETDAVISFVVPVYDEGETKPVKALIGRVPNVALNALIVGLDGPVGTGQGFIVDEQAHVIAHTDPDFLMDAWQSMAEIGQTVGAEGVNGRAYIRLSEDAATRELVYELTEPTSGWLVVTVVPYDVVLQLGWEMGAPLAAVIIIATALFGLFLANYGRRLTAPLTDLAMASGNLAVGRHDYTVAVGGHGEIKQIGSSLERVRRQSLKRASEMDRLIEVTQSLGKGFDINQSLPDILKGALRGTGASGIRAVFVTGRTPIRYGEGPAHEAMAAHDRRAASLAQHETAPLMYDNISTLRTKFSLSEQQSIPFKAAAIIPLRAANRFIGVIWLGLRQERRLDEGETNLMYVAGTQALALVEYLRIFSVAESGRRRLAAVLLSTADPVILIDQSSRILFTNPAFERAFRLDGSKARNQRVEQVLGAGSLLDALKSTTGRSRTFEVQAATGQMYYANVSPVVGTDRSDMGRVAVLHDITSYKQLERMKSDYVQLVSHELKSPLTAMRGFSSLLTMQGSLNADQQYYLSRIVDTIDRMDGMSANLLSITRLEDGAELQLTALRMERLIKEQIEISAAAAEAAGITFRTDIEAGLPVIYADNTLAAHAIANLLSNACKYAHGSGDVIVRASLEGDQLVVSVRDNGPGIATEHLHRLYEKFFRSVTRENQQIRGTGLGLAFVKMIAERHGGTAWCESDLGKGSEFFVTFSTRLKPSGPIA